MQQNLVNKNLFSTALEAFLKRQLFTGLMVSVLVITSAIAGDVKRVKKVFRKCKACHYVDKEKNKRGPIWVM